VITGISDYCIEAIGPAEALIEFTIPPAPAPPFPPGTTVYATISLSQVNTQFEGNGPDPTFVATAFIDSWTVNEDGAQSAPQSGSGFTQNAVFINNCATIKCILFVERAWAIAQVNVFTL
jgi:hypothetical protein